MQRLFLILSAHEALFTFDISRSTSYVLKYSSIIQLLIRRKAGQNIPRGGGETKGLRWPHKVKYTHLSSNGPFSTEIWPKIHRNLLAFARDFEADEESLGHFGRLSPSPLILSTFLREKRAKNGVGKKGRKDS